MFSFFKNRAAYKQFESTLQGLEISSLTKYKYESVKNLKTLAHEVQLFVMKDMVDPETFLEAFKDIRVDIASSSNSTNLNAVDYFKNFIDHVMKKDNGKYVFHDISRDSRAKKIMPQLIPIPRFIPARNMDALRISRLYAGGKYSGTNLHNHSAALNYLVEGKKLWITFPFNEKNKLFVEKHNMKYGQVKDRTLDWLSQSAHLLTEEGQIDDLKFFIQKKGEVALIPAGCFHAVVNLTDVMGITYSWND